MVSRIGPAPRKRRSATRREGHHISSYHTGVCIVPHLALRDVTRQVGDGVGDVIVGHREDGQLGDGTVPSGHATRSLVDGGQVGVHVPGVTTATGNFFASGGNLDKALFSAGDRFDYRENEGFSGVTEGLGGGEGDTPVALFYKYASCGTLIRRRYAGGATKLADFPGA